MTFSAIDNDEVLEELLVPIIERLENKDFDLPPLPHVASQVLALTADPDADAERLTSLIQQDPILTARVFQTANSAAFGSTRRIDSLQQAIAWLGLNHVAGTAFTLAMQSGIFNVGGYDQQVKGLWTYSIGTGFYAKTIADRLNGQNPSMAFLCGLLHAIGKPVIIHTVNQYRGDSSTPLPWPSMIKIMKESYIEVGRQLAEAWNFPEPVREAINLHEDHAYHLGTSPTKEAAITCLAISLISNLLNPESIHEGIPLVNYLKLSEDTINDLLNIQNAIQAQVEALLV